MKTKGFGIGIIFLVLMVCTTCTKDEVFLTPDGESSALKGKKADFMVKPSGDMSGVMDYFNIKEALNKANPGDVVQLAKGVFYLHKTLSCYDF